MRQAAWAQVEMLPPLLCVLDARAMTGSEAQRKLLLGNATLLAYCMRWQEFRVRLSLCSLPVQCCQSR